MAAPKGHKRWGGRRKGTPNKATAEVREMFKAALDELGGIDFLVKAAKKNPTAFMQAVTKLIPAEVNAKIEGGLLVDTRRSFVKETDGQEKN